MLSDLDKKVILALQRDLEICPRPFLEVAEFLGIGEEALLAAIRRLMARGYIRRFGATLRHQKSGFTANAMVAWQVDEDQVKSVGNMMAACGAVSHCYRRDPARDWPYNLYTMVHAADEPSCRAISDALSQKTGVDTYEILFSRKELKKTSMQYFDDDPDF